ncbi:MAG: rod shape-determining protein MreC [Patescibacteria group bacterium]|nr:hypothetical protein [Patescibacteria group bacterium]
MIGKIGSQTKFFLVLFLTLLILGVDRLGFLNPVKDLFGRLSSDFRGVFYRQMVRPVGEAEQFKKELASCLAEKIELEEENSVARRLIGSGAKPTTNFSLAKVIGLSRTEAVLAVSDGEAVKKGASLVSGRIFLGRVEEVESGLAKGLLLGSPDLKIPVRIWSDQEEALKNRASLAGGILTVEGDRLLVKEVLSSEKFDLGDWVGTVVETGEVFLIGEIEKIFPSEDKIFQKAEVKWAVNPENLLTVAIINGND